MSRSYRKSIVKDKNKYSHKLANRTARRGKYKYENNRRVLKNTCINRWDISDYCFRLELGPNVTQEDIDKSRRK